MANFVSPSDHSIASITLADQRAEYSYFSSPVFALDFDLRAVVPLRSHGKTVVSS